MTSAHHNPTRMGFASDTERCQLVQTSRNEYVAKYGKRQKIRSSCPQKLQENTEIVAGILEPSVTILSRHKQA